MSEPTEKIYKALAAAGIAEEPAGQIAEAVVAVRAETAKRRTANTGTTNIDEKFAKVHEEITNARLESRDKSEEMQKEMRDKFEEMQKEMRDKFDETQKETRDKFDGVQKQFDGVQKQFDEVQKQFAEVQKQFARTQTQITDLRDELKDDIAKARLETKDDITKSTNQTRNWNLGLTTAIIAAMGVTVAALKYF